MDCIFCKIIAGEVPADKVYGNNEVVAFLDIAPISQGHTLVVSKTHYADLNAMPREVAARMISALMHIAPAVMTATRAPAYNVGINTGSAAGQVVMHAHFHLIPRHPGDGLQSWPHQAYVAGEAAAVAQKIRAAIAPSY